MSGKKDNQLAELIQDRDIILKSDDCDKWVESTNYGVQTVLKLLMVA